MASDDIAISVRGLGKAYTIAHQSERSHSLGEAIYAWVRRPFEERQQRETFWALKDVNFDVHRGEVLGIIGRNGAGKSTLLKLLSRITSPTTGEIDIHGRVASLLEVGTGFHPELSGRENVYLNGTILGMKRSEIKRQFDAIVDFAEVEKFLDTPVKRYSSGMYVRLAFAVAAHLHTEILVVDEVLSVGDTAFQRKCMGKIDELASGGERVVLFVSHNLTTVRSLCKRVLWLSESRLYRDGPPSQIVEAYLANDTTSKANSFDVDRFQRHAGLDELVHLRHVALNGGEPIRHGEPLTITMEYIARGDAKGVAFGLVFFVLDGARVMAVDSDIPTGARYDLVAGESGRIQLFVEENHLQPSRYLLAAVARSGENYMFDYVHWFTQVAVLEGKNTPLVLIGREEAGCVRVPATCRHDRASLNGGSEGTDFFNASRSIACSATELDS
jgi:lipopolysaccharide transport system ATP-binding protein